MVMGMGMGIEKGDGDGDGDGDGVSYTSGSSFATGLSALEMGMAAGESRVG